MTNGGMNGERLTEVSRLASGLADQVLRESMFGTASPAKLTALGQAAHLLRDYDRPVPDLVRDVLGRIGADAAATEAVAEPEPPRGLLPRLMQTLRLPRS